MKNNKKIIVFITLASVLGSIALQSVPVVPDAQATYGHNNYSTCTLSPSQGRTIVHFGSMIRSDQSESRATEGPENVHLNSGSYRVTLVSYDNHSSKGDQIQPNEAWNVDFLDASGDFITSSGGTRDLPDNINTLTEVVNSSLSITQDVSSVLAYHSAYPSDNPNSITPVCAAFDRLDSNTDDDDEPDVTTLSADNIDDNSAVLNGDVDPNGEDTEVWFEWGTSSSNLDRATLREGVGDGTSALNFDRSISGLFSDTTYYFRAVAENSEGNDAGSIRSFRTNNNGSNPPTDIGSRPDTRTVSAIDIDEDSAVIRGAADPNNKDTEVWFEWGTAIYNLNRDTNRENIGSGSNEIDFDTRLAGLDENTRYYFRAVAENSEGIDKGIIKIFVTDDNNNRNGDGPEILDTDIRDIKDDSAELICEVDPNGEDTDVWFEYDDDEGDLEDGRGRKTRTEEINGNRGDERVEITILNLDRDTRYFYRCFAENRDGDDETRTDDFRTDDNNRNDDEPDVRTLSAEDIDNDSAVLNGEVDPNGEDTEVWFEYGLSSSNLSEDTRPDDIGDGTRREDFDDRITSLRSNTIYFYRAIAESREGIDRGSIKSFRTSGTTFVPPPTVITRFVDVVRNVEKEDVVKERDALIITLDSNKEEFEQTGEIEYTVSYENETEETFTEAVLVVEIPRELEFVDASPREDDEDRNEVIFEIGTIDAHDEDSFDVLFEIGRRVDDGDEVEFVAYIEYLDRSKNRTVQVVDVSTIGEMKGSSVGFGAAFAGSLASFFTNPFFWLLILLVLMFIVYRYFALLGSTRDSDENFSGPEVALQPISPPGPVQQQFPTGNNI